ncbi:MAG: DUF58 domain-containing protein [Planctomycetaceae bacterium]|nr:DUF58 domain-containing protein [Planctomycetaceae bacterium]
MNQSSPQSAPPPKFTLIAAISILLLLGMVSGAALWIMAAIAVGLLIAVNFFLTKTWSTATVASRQGGDTELTAGSTHEVVITVTNQSKLPVLWLLVEDLLPAKAMSYDPPRLRVSGDRIRLLMMWGQATRKLKYQIACNRRGYFQVGPTILETGDMMGLYRRYRAGNQPQYVTVLPRVVPLTTYEIGSRRPIGEIRMRESIMDDPTRLRGIRQWEPGDPMRSVHWSATARTGTLHSKVYEPSSIIGATLIMDLHQRTTPQRHEPVRSDLAITAAASIATALHESNEPVGIATNARDAADRIRQEGWQGDHRVRGLAQAAASMLDESERLRPIILAPARGPNHLREIMRTLARLEITDGLTFSELLVECESQISAETTLLVILQQAEPETIAALIGLQRRGRAVAIIINTHDINDYSSIAGPLIASRIPTFHLASADAISDVCRQTLLR